jgi:hypothetical protein
LAAPAMPTTAMAIITKTAISFLISFPPNFIRIGCCLKSASDDP